MGRGIEQLCVEREKYARGSMDFFLRGEGGEEEDTSLRKGSLKPARRNKYQKTHRGNFCRYESEMISRVGPVSGVGRKTSRLPSCKKSIWIISAYLSNFEEEDREEEDEKDPCSHRNTLWQLSPAIFSSVLSFSRFCFLW